MFRLKNITKSLFIILIIISAIECKIKDDYDWLTLEERNDVCLNAQSCYIRIKKITLNRLTEMKEIKNIECKCKGYNGYQCGSEYCTASKDVCNQLKTKKKKNDDTRTTYKSCNNGNMAIKTSQFNFKLRF